MLMMGHRNDVRRFALMSAMLLGTGTQCSTPQGEDSSGMSDETAADASDDDDEGSGGGSGQESGGGEATDDDDDTTTGSSSSTTGGSTDDGTTTGSSTSTTTFGTTTGDTDPTSTSTSTSGGEESAEDTGDTTYAPGSDLPIPPLEDGQPAPSGTPGELQILNWAGFQAAATYTFDDNTQSQTQNWSTLAGLEVPFTFYLISNNLGSPVWSQARDAGSELANHTSDHQRVHGGSGASLDMATQALQSAFQVEVHTMAAPYGDPGYAPLAESRFIINRGVNGGVIMPNGNQNPFDLPSYIPPQGASADALNTPLNSARQQGGWATWCIHGFTNVSDGAYQPITLDGFVQHIEYVKGLGDVWIGTMVDVGAYWLGQRAVSQAQPVDNGGTLTWTWQLPDNFPSGKFLRVRLSGGRPSQDGMPLRWDGHGYYEVSLDAGSLVVEP